MGGGLSSHQDVEAVLACTMLVGEAMLKSFDPKYVRFPDMYRLYDFHSGRNKHQTLESPMTFLVLGQDGIIASPKNSSTPQILAAEEDSYPEEDYMTLFIDQDKIVLKRENLNEQNQDGWTPLHSCCHTVQSVDAGCKIIDELRKTENVNFNLKTTRGPGSFTTGWTPLHIACAYGLDKIVVALIDAGADVNTTNSVEWTPLHDSCYRGYTGIARALIKAGANFNTICPSFTLCPFPSQYPLAEACRQGHLETAKLLINLGAEKDSTNDILWTPLHEASYHNRKEIVQMLIVHGVDVSLRTNKNVLAKDLTLHSEIRSMLEDMGKESNVKKSPTKVDCQNALEKKDSPKRLSKPKSPKKELKAEPLSKKEDFSMLGDLPGIDAHRKVDEKEEGHTEEQGESNKKKKKKKDKTPIEFKCAVSRKLMMDPMKSPFGHNFEKKVIQSWIHDFGHRCPITGEPLALNQLEENVELKKKISEWQNQKQKPVPKNESPTEKKEPVLVKNIEFPESKVTQESEDDLYDF